MIKGFRTVVISKPSILDYSLGNLGVRNSGEKIKISIDEIHTIIIENIQSNISVYLMKEFIKRNINVIICDEKHLPIGEILPLYGNYASSKKLQLQLEWSSEIIDKTWNSILAKKITNQIAVLNRRGLSESAEILEGYLQLFLTKPIEFNDMTEAKCAAQYFRALFSPSFSRRNSEFKENMNLNYVYAILLATVSRFIVSLGYKTELGIFHRGGENNYNLACDLMEPFRPICDEYVVNYLSSDFAIDNPNDKHYLADILNQKIIVAGQENYFNNAIEIYVQSVFRALNEGDISQILFPEEWSFTENNNENA